MPSAGHFTNGSGQKPLLIITFGTTLPFCDPVLKLSYQFLVAVQSTATVNLVHMVVLSLDGNVLSVDLFVCPVPTLTFESLDLETSFLLCRYNGTSSEYLDEIHILRSSGQGHGLRSITNYTHSR